MKHFLKKVRNALLYSTAVGLALTLSYFVAGIFSGFVSRGTVSIAPPTVLADAPAPPPPSDVGDSDGSCGGCP